MHYFFVNPSNYYDEAASILTILNSSELSLIKADQDFLLHFISLAHSIKKVFIETDEFDTGPRKKLNLGHTFGHAFEVLSSYSIPHGVSVLLGILYSEFLSSPTSFERYCQRSLIFFPIIQLLSRYYSDEIIELVNIILCDKDLLLNTLRKDKKNSHIDQLTYVVFDRDVCNLTSGSYADILTNISSFSVYVSQELKSCMHDPSPKR